MLIDCADSRVNEQEIFSALPGTLFTAGNIANRFDEEDPNSYVVSFMRGRPRHSSETMKLPFQECCTLLCCGLPQC